MKAMENALGKPDEVYRVLLQKVRRSDTERACPSFRYGNLLSQTTPYVQQPDQW